MLGTGVRVKMGAIYRLVLAVEVVSVPIVALNREMVLTDLGQIRVSHNAGIHCWGTLPAD